MNELTHLDLFSGIGGFAIGFQNAGFRTIAFAETEPHASLVLKHHWPEIPNLGDVTKLCRRAYDCEQPADDESGEVWCPRCDVEFGECQCIGTDQFTDEHGFPLVITGGVPCQPASALGLMRGTADDRWLWPEAFRIVRELGPRFAVFENPPAILALESGRTWNGIVSGFSALGYDLWWDVFPAAVLGAGHLRERVVLFLANADDARLEGYAGHGAGSCAQRRRGTLAHRPIATPHLQSRRCDHPQWYAAQSPVQPVVDGLPNRLVVSALHCVGNAIVPELAQVIAETISAVTP